MKVARDGSYSVELAELAKNDELLKLLQIMRLQLPESMPKASQRIGFGKASDVNLSSARKKVAAQKVVRKHTPRRPSNKRKYRFVATPHI